MEQQEIREPVNNKVLSPSLERSNAAVSENVSEYYEAPTIPLVLAADDNETHLLYIKRIVESMGFECVTTTVPSIAVRIALEKRPAIMLCDINFGIGKLSGIEIFSDIRRSNAHLPFIIISAFLQQQMKDRASKLGITHYITKPYEPEQLKAVIKSLIGNGRLAQ
ncbi:MAG: response regulator [Bacteroidota bacterium]|jgi:CheY-like chemotaxis protein